METSRCLLDSVSQEKLSVKLTGKLGRPSAQQLQAFLEQFRYVCMYLQFSMYDDVILCKLVYCRM